MGPRGGLGPTTYEFTCSNCKKTVTTGISQFSAEHIANCPHCGVRFNNTMAGETAKRMDEMKQRMDEMAGRARGWDNRGGVPPSGPSTPVQPPPPVNKPPSQPFNRDLVDPFEPISNTSPTSGPPVKSNRGTTIVLIIFVVGGLVLLLMVAGIGGLVWMITTAPKTHGSGGTRRRPRRPNNYEAV